MRYLMALMALVSFSAYGAFDVTATMPDTLAAESCQLYLDGGPVGEQVPCGEQEYASLLPGEGTYTFAYLTVNEFGESNLSPERTVSIGQPPDDPTEPPDIVITCLDENDDPAECPDTLVITITP